MARRAFGQSRTTHAARGIDNLKSVENLEEQMIERTIANKVLAVSIGLIFVTLASVTPSAGGEGGEVARGTAVGAGIGLLTGVGAGTGALAGAIIGGVNKASNKKQEKKQQKQNK
jgi:hypothetical protein